MASMNTRLNIEKINGNIIKKHGGSKQVGFKQLGPGVEIGVHGVHDEKRVWFEVKLQRAQGDHEAKVFQVSNDDTAVAQRRLEDKQPEEKTNMDWWKIKTGNVLNSCNQSIKQGMLEPVKVKCIFLGYYKSIVGNKLWKLDDVTSKVVLYRNMDFNETREYKKTFIGSGVSTGSMQVLHGFEFEVEPLGDHTFEVEPQENVDQGIILQKIVAIKKIYAHESLTFNNTVACEVIFKWKAGLKDDMDTRSDVKAEIKTTKGLLAKAKGNVLGMKIVMDHSGNTLRVSQSMFYNGKLVQTLLERHFILLLEGSLSWDCDVKKNVGSHEYQVVCTRPNITSVSVDMLDEFDRGLQTNIQVFVDFDYAMRISIIVMSRSITRYGLMILGCAGSLKANLQHMEALSTTEAGYMTFTEA
nr:zinc finger, CCHC-type [Tanacetum cinerariifolium]